MRRIWLLALFFGAFCLLGSGIALAQYNDYQKKIMDQQRRIDQGIASGRLTRGEANLLQDNLNVIKMKLSRYKADGRLGARERTELDSLLDRNSAMIYKEKHDISGFYDSEFQKRIEDQQRKIDQGIMSGSLTRSEADTLQDNLNWIKMRFSKLRSDGMLNFQERERLDRMLDQNSAMIYKNKHNLPRRIY